ncbi:DUF4331 family protein [Kitasatospora sp. NPDC002040]|uniref:DUF4331 family protein n=1 Tax=Kitasatospora sp. NPDC002040 TaxID=3154661 RepID=UPI003328EE55
MRVFDLLYGGNLSETGQNTPAGYNVNSLSIQVPKSRLAFKGDAIRNPVIGVWSTTAKQTMKLTPGGRGRPRSPGPPTSWSSTARPTGPGRRSGRPWRAPATTPTGPSACTSWPNWTRTPAARKPP